VGAAVGGQRRILRDDVHGEADALGVFERAARDQQVRQWREGIADADHAGGGQRGHVRQRFAAEVLGQRAEHAHVDAAGAGDARLDAVDHRRRVDHRARVGRNHQRGDAAGLRGGRFGADGGLVRGAGLAQARAQVDHARHQPETLGRERAVEPALWRLAAGVRDQAVFDRDEAGVVEFAGGVEQPRAGDEKRRG